MIANPDFGTIGGLSGDIQIADKDVTTRSDKCRSPLGPDILPPRILRNGAQFGSTIIESQIPGLHWSLIDFAVDFVRVTVGTQSFQVLVNGRERSIRINGVKLEISGKSGLPNLVDSFDLSLSLRRVSQEKRDVIKFEASSELGLSFRGIRPKEGGLIDVDF